MLSKLFRFVRSKTYKDTPSSLPATLGNQTSIVATVPLPPIKKLSVTDTLAPSAKHILILNLGDVLFHYSLSAITALINPPGWAALECGLITEDIAVQRISKDLTIDIDTICEALAQCRQLLRVDHDLFQ
jgi:hypothetical protein